LAFPDRDHAPTEAAQGGGVALVAGGVAFEFFAPPRPAGFWNAGVFAIPMEMPEAPVHENADPVARENNVGISRKVAAVKPEAVAHGMQHAANDHLRLGILPANPAHQATALLWTQSVCHPSKNLSRIWVKAKARSVFENQLDKIHPSTVREIDPRSVGAILELNHHPFGIHREHISENARMFRATIVVNNPAAGLDLVNGSKWSHGVYFFPLLNNSSAKIHGSFRSMPVS